MTDSRKTIDKDQLRENIRRSMEGSGPLFFHNRYKDKDKAYYWGLYDSKQPIKFQQILDLGYDYTKIDDMPNLLQDCGTSKQNFNLVDDEGRIGVKINPTQTQYLLQIPLERYNLIQEIKEEDYNEKISRIKHKLSNAQILGDARMISGSLKSSKYN